jgi:hypothetical protein
MKFAVTFSAAGRDVVAKPVFGEPSAIDPERKRTIRILTSAVPGSGPVSIAQVGPTELAVQTTVEKKALSARAPEERGDTQPGDHEVTARAGRA